ncbi:MAG: hypothetical protein CMD25_00605 [Flavobacteriales bacterium]|jgi:hypothetical protein|nr:hypothetical protein [Flavobacteriales bacterium]
MTLRYYYSEKAGTVIDTLKEHKDLIMEAFNPIGDVFDEMEAQFDLMINEAERILNASRRIK